MAECRSPPSRRARARACRGTHAESDVFLHLAALRGSILHGGRGGGAKGERITDETERTSISSRAPRNAAAAAFYLSPCEFHRQRVAVSDTDARISRAGKRIALSISRPVFPAQKKAGFACSPLDVRLTRTARANERARPELNISTRLPFRDNDDSHLVELRSTESFSCRPHLRHPS